jgi:hypothetical protein
VKGRPARKATSELRKGGTVQVDTKARTRGFQVKAKVASEAGEARYGLPIGTELGQARNAQAQAAQDNTRARDQYESLVSADPADVGRMLEDLDDADLKSLSAITYSFRSSNPKVVAARLALAAALRRRGLDVNDYGGLGRLGGKPGRARTGKTATPKRTPRAGSRRAVNAVVRGDSVDATTIGRAEVARLRAEGWRGDPNDRSERLYRPGHPQALKTGRPDGVEAKGYTQKERERMHTLPGTDKFPIESESDLRSAIRLHTQSDEPTSAVKRHIVAQARRLGLTDKLPDGWASSGSKGVDEFDTEHAEGWLAVELKRTTTKPWETRKAQRGGKTIGAEKSDEKGGGDEYPVKTIGDIAAGVKRAKKITDPARRKEVLAHLRKGAKAIGGPAVNMVPSDDAAAASGKGSGKGGGFVPFKKGGKKDATWGDLITADDMVLAAAIEAKVMSANPGAVKLREYWAHGPGRAKWKPGTPGDFTRLRNAVRRYIPSHMLNGWVANVHKLATGEWPGKGRGHGKAAHVELQVKGGVVLSKAELDDAAGVLGGSGVRLDGPGDGLDADMIDLSLDRFEQMEEEVTSEDAYEQALADEVDWELASDGTLIGPDDEDDELPEGEPVEEPDVERAVVEGVGMLDELLAFDD